MASDYERISQENLEEYGRNRTGWREDLPVDLYPDRTHFVFELLSGFPGSRGEAKTGAPGPAPPGRIASRAASAAVPM